MSKLNKYIIFIGLVGLLTNCKKEEEKVQISSNPIAPTFKALPDLTLKRANASDSLVFSGTPVDPGFKASANYFLEACVSGNNFKDSIPLVSSVPQDSALKITVGDLNTLLLKKFPAYTAVSLDFRIRAVLVVDAGTGALGSKAHPLSYSSQIQTVSLTPYGLPVLNLNNSGITQSIPGKGIGQYSGYVKLDATKPFTLKDPETNTEYGDNGGKLAAGGNGISVALSGWYLLTVNTTNLTYTAAKYMVGVVGQFNGWAAPDSMMNYDSKNGYWIITMDLPAGPMKFRLNNDWGVNWGPDNAGGDATLPDAGGAITLPDSKGNIIIAAGNYTITFTIDPSGTSGKANFKKNSK